MLITGTGTEVGKTWVGVSLLAVLRSRGLAVAARKPAQSFDPVSIEATDAQRLAAASGEAPNVVCLPHRTYPLAMAPPMAAAALGLSPFTIAELTDEVERSWPAPAPAVGLLEGAGGLAAPQADDGDTVALIDALRPDLVVVVAPAGLGTINLVRLCVRALQHGGAIPRGGATAPPRSPRPRVVAHLNRWDGADILHRANRRWLAERDGAEVTVTIEGLADRVLRS